MKNSGIEWIGEIPDNWEIIPNKYLFENHSVKVGATWDKYKLLSLTTMGVKEKDSSVAGGKVPDSYENYQTVVPGDMIFCLFDLDCSAVFSGVSPYYGMITSAYDVYEINKKLADNLYVDYLFQYAFSNRYYKIYSKNIRYTVTTEMFKSIRTPIPPLDTQMKIGTLLSNKCSKVDKLIEVQQAQIEKLKEYKQSVITEAVTKGLDPFAPMKDSGIEWLGKIQTTFLVEPLKFLLCEPMMYGANEKGDKTKEYYRYIRITDIESDGGLKESDDNQYLTHDVGCYYELRDGDVLFARSGGTVGKSFIFNESYGKCAFAGYLIKASCNVDALLPEYLYYYTQSSIYERWKNSVFIQATIQNIGANKFSMLPIVICSIDEQSKIVYAIKNKCAKIDKLIALKQEKIEKLNEYKKSLIYEYVTGKKEVV